MSKRQSVSRRVLSRMPSLSRPLRLGLSLVLLSLSVLFAGDLLGLRLDAGDSLRDSRKRVAESLAIQLSALASLDDDGSLEYAVGNFVARSEDVSAAELVRANGSVVSRYGDKAVESLADDVSTTSLAVPILRDDLQWGELRIVFEQPGDSWRELFWYVFVAVASLLSFSLFLGKVLVQLDPGKAVPGRVDSAFNLFSAGVLILDARLRIVMANRAAAALTDRPADSLIGGSLDKWAWVTDDEWQAPWATTLHSGLAVSDQQLRLRDKDGSMRLFSVSCASVGDGSAGLSGVLVTLDDLTPVERKNSELTSTLAELQRSQNEIQEQNEELERLATTDPLTGVANRRRLMERLDDAIDIARGNDTPLACIMSDIDHFKRVNDTLGHAVGDDVICLVANALQGACREDDLVGRYGGEEFVMVLPGLDANAARDVAERVRVGVIALGASDQTPLEQLSSSFGIADLSQGAEDASALVDQADSALYAAKEAGRNCVVVHADRDAVVKDGGSTMRPVQPSGDDMARARVVELESLVSRHESDLLNLRDFDTLTGVPMRALFQQRIQTELLRAERAGSLVGVLAFELRDIERIVRTFGHAVCDALVVAFVERLQKGLRTTDLVADIAGEHSLSRITSNEFGVLLADLNGTEGALVVVARLKRLLQQPFSMGEEKVYLGVNIGIALSEMSVADAGHTSAETADVAVALFEQASEARVEAALKPDKVSHGFASSALDAASRDYIRLEVDLHEALASGALETWFQPKFDLAERRVTGMEALLRWRHETRGFVSPEIFVAVAEANGLIERLSSCVLDATLEQIKVWRAMGFDDLCVSINVSPMQLRAHSLVEDTLIALDDAGVSGSQLEIELTETSVMERPEEARAALQALRDVGVRISMDDFGTGYTSLALLAKLPLDTVKIDRSFVATLDSDQRNRSVVESVISMAHALKLRVVGEGIETNDQLEIMADLGCDEVQGYLISRPLPAREITAFLLQQRAAERRIA